ncbi:unnamed protein product [Microthlaspi erraticum]|uniref:Uncharacterized protein n=1 Tax=Microthlaspi erraticum TaxID=1685480 RepID=A0A6D2JKW8_9BRAS|nr:unnamed protein product [Microthlaspi erraticum]
MDFIKTSSLRALIELTFQRNWNGLIWMSRKGVITKRVKTVQTALSRTAPSRSPAGRERMFRARPRSIRRPVSAKVQPSIGRSRITTRETMSRGRPRHATQRCRARPCRASREATPRGRATSHVPRPMRRPSRESHVPRPAEKHRPTSSVRPQRPTTNPSGHDRSDRTRP